MIAPLPKTMVAYFVSNVFFAFLMSLALVGRGAAAMAVPFALIAIFPVYVLVTRHLAGVRSIYPTGWTARASQLVLAARIVGGIMIAALWIGAGYVILGNPNVMLRAGLLSESGAGVLACLLAITAAFFNLMHARDWSKSRPGTVKLYTIVLPVVLVPLISLFVAGTYIAAEHVIGVR
jgi:hypothetical protein